MKHLIKRLSQGALAALFITLGACGGGDGDSSSSGSGTTNSPAGMGTLRLALTDAPACGYDHVYVTVERVRVHQSSTAGDGDGGWSEVVLSPARRVDLLSLTNGVLDELGQTTLPAGRYTQMRMVLAPNGNSSPYANAVHLTGAEGEIALTTPSAQQSGLKMNINIDVAADQLADFVIDFDACKSIVRAGNSGRYLLKPVINVIPRYVSGVAGYANVCTPNTTVSLQQDGTIVRATVPEASGRFLLQPVAPGNYTLVVTTPGYTTTAVTGVPVSADTVLPFNSAENAIPCAVSASGVATASGSVTITPAPASIEASARAVQTLSAGPVIEVASTLVDETTGLFEMSQLPLDPPLVTPFLVATPNAFTFTPDTAAAGRYTVQASAGGEVKNAGPFLFTSGANIASFFTFP
jgi:hypothetical protein